jgi:hypothetical protein
VRVAITGDRRWASTPENTVWDVLDVVQALKTLDPESFVILGDARGADATARLVCEDLGLTYVVHRADWAKHARGAGSIRNRAMLDDGPDEVWYFHRDLAASKGTADCVREARRRGITVRDGTTVGV